MIAKITKVEEGYIAKYERHFHHSVDSVWAMLTENDKLSQWFSELRIEDLKKDGVIKFDMQDGTFEEMKILDFKTNSVLEYTWGEDIVRFELSSEQEGCRLVLIEKIKQLTDHTPKDLAGWHVCLDVVQALLDGETIQSRKQLWEKWYVEYVTVLKRF
ncbi:SRPBCC family protein [Solibacillus sp. CAU 1738]|uniref:SRPBCC family protein n=1 Tax=Solibacillus sp. CAU 1738 TaxID=3140363 RepID=UPI003260AEB1